MWRPHSQRKFSTSTSTFNPFYPLKKLPRLTRNSAVEVKTKSEAQAFHKALAAVAFYDAKNFGAQFDRKTKACMDSVFERGRRLGIKLDCLGHP
jgi:hypothetical protein